MLQKIKKLLFYLSMAPLRVAAYEVSDWNGELERAKHCAVRSNSESAY